MTAPLAGTRVLDLTRLLPGNYATLLLAALGADVIKVEDSVAGDGTRQAPPFAAGGSVAHAILNRGKRSVQCDLKLDTDREWFLRLVENADVLVDSFRPGVLARLGLGPDVLAAHRPTLVHVSLTAYGEGGRASWPGHDINAQALAGLLSLTAGADGVPPMPGVQVADLAAGLHVALAVVSGMHSVQRNGRGFRANVAMVDAAYTFLGLAGAQAAASNLGAAPAPGPGHMLNGGLACYDLYRCSDDRYVAVGALEPQFFARFCELLGKPELASWQYDLSRQGQLRDDIATLVLSETSEHWGHVMSEADTCVTVVNDVVSALRDTDATTRGVVTTTAGADGSSIDAVRVVPWLSGEDDPSGAPALGADSQVVRTAALAGEWPARRQP